MTRDNFAPRPSEPIVLVGPAHPLRGGIAQFTDQLFLHLSQQSPVDVFTFYRLFPKLFFPGRTQLDTSQSAIEVPTHLTLDSIGPSSWWRTAAAIAQRRPRAIVVMHQMPFFAPCTGTLMRLLRRRVSAPQILLCHNLIPHEPHWFDAPLTRFLLAAPDAFIVLSQTVERDLLRFRPRAKFIRVPMPLYEHFPASPSRQAAREKLALSADQFIVLFFGLIRAYKGLDILLQALVQVPAAQLLIAGEFYRPRREYERQIRELQIVARVRIDDRYVPHEEVPFYFAAADVVVLPYLTATQSGVTKLAYHFERPVIVTDTGGLAEEVEVGKTGYVVPPNDPAALAAAIERIRHESERIDFAAHIREFKKRFSWARLGEAIEELMK